jgi:hypothetical protein
LVLYLVSHFVYLMVIAVVNWEIYCKFRRGV